METMSRIKRRRFHDQHPRLKRLQTTCLVRWFYPAKPSPTLLHRPPTVRDPWRWNNLWQNELVLGRGRRTGEVCEAVGGSKSRLGAERCRRRKNDKLGCGSGSVISMDVWEGRGWVNLGEWFPAIDNSWLSRSLN
jgi:hypothetical protein